MLSDRHRFVIAAVAALAGACGGVKDPPGDDLSAPPTTASVERALCPDGTQLGCEVCRPDGSSPLGGSQVCVVNCDGDIETRWCYLPPTCGHIGQACCPSTGCYLGDSQCIQGICTECGRRGQVCCPSGPACGGGMVCNTFGRCSSPPECTPCISGGFQYCRIDGGSIFTQACVPGPGERVATYCEPGTSCSFFIMSCGLRCHFPEGTSSLYLDDICGACFGF